MVCVYVRIYQNISRTEVTMSRPRKLSPKQVAAAAVDKRSGMSWKALSKKYKCAVNTLRFSLAEYSSEFAPVRRVYGSELESRLDCLQSDIDKIKSVLLDYFNVSV